jgi:3-phenylpropionate/trans-cinnamate dioxygenase ferredoxin reductase subunit
VIVTKRLSEIVVVGASLAGLRTAEALRDQGFDGRLTIIGDEPHRPYNRPPLSKQVLAGSMGAEDLMLPTDDARLEAVWRLGVSATGLDVAGKRVWIGRGERLRFDGLVIATGAGARVPAIPGINGPDVLKLRTLDDALSLRSRLQGARRVVVVGAGFIGCEVAASARELGKEVWLVDPVTRPMSRVLPPEVSEVFRRMHQLAGVHLMLGRTVQAFAHGGEGTHVQLDKGDVLPADLVIVGLGSAPNTGWLYGTGLRCNDGVLCDESCRVVGTQGAIVAAGDIVNWPHAGLGGRRMRVEHWNQASEQAAVAARALLDPTYVEPYAPVLSLWSDQYGRKLQVVGTPSEADRCEVVAGSLEEHRFAMDCFKGKDRVGAIALAMPAAMAPMRRRMEAAMRLVVGAMQEAA